MKEDFFKPNFSLPFFHLRTEKFWYLKTNTGKEIQHTSSHSIKSFAQLLEAVAYAFIDEALFVLLKQPEARNTLYQFLLEYYFDSFPSSRTQPRLFEEVAGQILHEPAALYKLLIENADEEEIFIRCAVLKRVVPKI